jgi:hypothetical protein
MPLPKIELPIYADTIPSTGKPIKYRPFTVKEQKLFLMAAEATDDPNEVLNSISQVVNNCIIEGEFDVLTCPSIDLEYMFLRLRSKSMGEVINLRYLCKTQVPKKDEEEKMIACNYPLDVAVDLNQVTAEVNQSMTTTIKVGADSAIILSYPTYADSLLSKSEEDGDIRLVARCIKKMVQGEEVLSVDDTTIEERVEFLNSLTDADVSKIDTWIKNEPVIKFKTEQTCPRCGTVHAFDFEGINDFFQ